MENLMNIASYVFNRYLQTKGERIDEMKLHKMLRNAYKDNLFYAVVDEQVIQRIVKIMDKVFIEYADKDSWSLSRLTHGEISWRNSRQGIADGENGDYPMDIEDIRKDAERVRTRRAGLAKLGLA